MSCQDQPSSCLLDLEQLQPFGQRTKGGDRAQPDVGVVAGGAFCDLESRFMPSAYADKRRFVNIR